jgi:hypothetical protein
MRKPQFGVIEGFRGLSGGVKKSHPTLRLLMRAALMVFQTHELQKQSRDREGADNDFFAGPQ